MDWNITLGLKTIDQLVLKLEEFRKRLSGYIILYYILILSLGMEDRINAFFEKEGIKRTLVSKDDLTDIPNKKKV